MTDRVPGSPGRYSAVVAGDALQKMQAGDAFSITLTRDDDPIKEGTPYSKAAVLPDDLAGQLCPDIPDPSPADAFWAIHKSALKGTGIDLSGCQSVLEACMRVPEGGGAFFVANGNSLVDAGDAPFQGNETQYFVLADGTDQAARKTVLAVLYGETVNAIKTRVVFNGQWLFPWNYPTSTVTGKLGDWYYRYDESGFAECWLPEGTIPTNSEYDENDYTNGNCVVIGASSVSGKRVQWLVPQPLPISFIQQPAVSMSILGGYWVPGSPFMENTGAGQHIKVEVSTAEEDEYLIMQELGGTKYSVHVTGRYK